MKLGYVVLYVNSPDDCLQFWTEKIGMIEKGVQVTELADHGGITSFAFIDNEGRGFAVLDSK
jgi:catechol 2,3-dioxygenase-like lactoylglutathione lyase family enzyme